MKGITVIIVVAQVLLFFVSIALAQGYDLLWWTVDGGGGTTSQGGNYALSGTMGQPDAGLMSGGSYTLRGGFWRNAGGSGRGTDYLPIVVKKH
jgi:hypothetical protein